jgi:hypothetical protein
MDVNEYLYERIARDRLNEARACAAAVALREAARGRRPSIRRLVGDAFVQLGQWVRDGHAPEARSSPDRQSERPPEFRPAKVS